jgi:hypothetical protein
LAIIKPTMAHSALGSTEERLDTEERLAALSVGMH